MGGRRYNSPKTKMKKECERCKEEFKCKGKNHKYCSKCIEPHKVEYRKDYRKKNKLRIKE